MKAYIPSVLLAFIAMTGFFLPGCGGGVEAGIQQKQNGYWVVGAKYQPKTMFQGKYLGYIKGAQWEFVVFKTIEGNWIIYKRSFYGDNPGSPDNLVIVSGKDGSYQTPSWALDTRCTPEMLLPPLAELDPAFRPFLAVTNNYRLIK